MQLMERASRPGLREVQERAAKRHVLVVGGSNIDGAPLLSW